MWNGTPSSVVGSSPACTAAKMESTVSRCGTVSAAPRYPVDAGVPVDLRDEVRRRATDHFGRSGRTGAELQQAVCGLGGPPRVRRDGLGHGEERPQPARGRALHEHLRLDSFQDAVHLVLREPVVQQRRLPAQPPGGQQVGHERQRRRQPQGDGTARPEPRRGERLLPLPYQRAQRDPADPTIEIEAYFVISAGKQHIVDPTGR
jgi:hypothetical protein